MAKMHENELEIDEHLVRHLLKNQCPQWSNLLLSPLKSTGTDNALFRLGSKYVVRLPRVEWSPGLNKKNIDKEYEWLPKIAQQLRIPISLPIFKGSPDKEYPYPWLISLWAEGVNINFESNDEYKELAIELAGFLNQMHKIALNGGPTSRRGIRLNNKILNTETRNAIIQLSNELDTQQISNLWDELSNIPYWDKDLVWVHGDFLPGNILVENGHLSAVLDFTDVGMGDPACDLVIAWALFNPVSRQVFRENLENIDNNTWERGRGWALSIALIMLPYYKHSNLVLATLARRMLANVLGDK